MKAQRGLPRDQQLDGEYLLPRPGEDLDELARAARLTEFHTGKRRSDPGGFGARGRCAACGAVASALNRLVQDHCHRTGQVRGMLCRSCNIIEGQRGTQWRPVVLYRQAHPAAILGHYEPYHGRGWQWGWSRLEHPREAARADREWFPRPATPWPPFPAGAC